MCRPDDYIVLLSTTRAKVATEWTGVCSSHFNSSELSKNMCEQDNLMINCQNGILIQQIKFSYNVKLINYIYENSANSVNEIYFINAYNNKSIY